MNISPDQAKKIFEADLANILKKVQAGKSLTTQERAIIQMSSGDEKISVPPYAKNKTQLAKILGISRQALDVWWKMPEAPKPLSNHEHDVAQWQRFVQTRSLKGSSQPEKEGLALRILKAQAAKLERQEKIAEGHYLPKTAILSSLVKIFAAIRMDIESIELIAPQLAGLSTHEIAKRLRESLREALQHLSESKWMTHTK